MAIGFKEKAILTNLKSSGFDVVDMITTKSTLYKDLSYFFKMQKNGHFIYSGSRPGRYPEKEFLEVIKEDLQLPLELYENSYTEEEDFYKFVQKQIIAKFIYDTKKSALFSTDVVKKVVSGLCSKYQDTPSFLLDLPNIDLSSLNEAIRNV